ncbi:Acyl carrier protein [Spiroplasma sp. JKS002669]|uniref:acyl carrier protein n=1 Tax=Spiroplasma attinicola TaxID=2904537 RepID=UPI0020230F4F|nr:MULTISPECIES: acyl carrier protein [unclassified Spiroplasma]MCL6428977.1 Acyl carrier protein [Spiroplasma sp. JKS002669]MCL8209716.1 Acyl carrier protein [Spiroplasma sp. JKS002670]MCL8210530.1 Acyl carrier protein [Spiroplasma sp. JKS002671]
MDIFKTIQKIIKTNYPQIKENITLDTVLGDIEYLDSLELATIAVELEDKYQIRFPDEDLEELKNKTVKEIVKEIEKLIANKKN